MAHIPTIVLTGGPCAGKTTALAAMGDRLTGLGFRPFIKAEDATALMLAGLRPTELGFQEAVLERTLHEEALLQRHIERTGIERAVILADRGINDQLGYMDREPFHKLCAQYDIDSVIARDGRYTGVIFLRSAAVGAPSFYSNGSNATRYETLEQARVLDQRTLEGWVGTPHLAIIENKPGHTFEQKILQSVGALARLLGIPEPLEKERKFLLNAFDPSTIPTNAVGVDIVQTYLVSAKPNIAERVRARGQNDSWVYFHTTKSPRTAGVSVECDSHISRHEYDNFLVRRNGSLVSIHKKRWCFEYGGQYCELDVFTHHRQGLALLEVEYGDEDAIDVPPFLGSVTDVTDDPRYSNYALAHIG